VSVAALERNVAALLSRLDEGVRQLGIALDAAQQRTLLDFLQLLSKWNSVYNLTAVRDVEEMVTLHLLDSLAIVPLMRERKIARLLDVGSGAGLPGIPIAIALPEVEVTLVDSVMKKVSFLNQVKGTLSLRITPLHSRVEALTSNLGYDCITSRAFSSVSDFISSSAHLLAPDGIMIALKARVTDDETGRLPHGFALAGVVPLHVPGLDAPRCAVLVVREPSVPVGATIGAGS
jgi:16S rRNA (guanine527-N7)-methyltransferase